LEFPPLKPFGSFLPAGKHFDYLHVAHLGVNTGRAHDNPVGIVVEESTAVRNEGMIVSRAQPRPT
jgi:hypothetical protein